MGKVRIGKVKSVSNELVNKYSNVFATDFDTNKKLVYQYSDITSKRLNNRVAGYITRLKVNEHKRAEAEAAEAEEVASIETPVGEAPGAEAQAPPTEPLEEEAAEEAAAGDSVEVEAPKEAHEEGIDKAENETPKGN